MIKINEVDRSVTVVNENADYVVVDGQIFPLTEGNIFLSNLPTLYDVEVIQVLESHYIPKPEPPAPEELPEEFPEEDPTPNE